MDEIEFLRKAGKLKATKRTGWIIEGITSPESVAEHSFRTALMALVLGHSRKDLDVGKAGTRRQARVKKRRVYAHA